MDQRPEDKTVSAEESMKRLSAIQFLLFSVLLALPLIGLMVGAVLAIRIVISVIARSKNMARDMAIAAALITVGLFGMVVEVLWIVSGHVVLALAADAALNYCILTMFLTKHLGHVFTKPELQSGQ